MKPSKASPPRVRARERQKQALALRMAGATYQQIAEALGVSVTGAYKMVMTALNKLEQGIAEDAEKVRELELERLDALLRSLWTAATQGDRSAIDRVLRIMERRSRLLGIDAVQNVQVNGPVEIQFRWSDDSTANPFAQTALGEAEESD